MEIQINSNSNLLGCDAV